MLRVTIHPECHATIRKALERGVYTVDDLLGAVTLMLNGDDPRSIREQLDKGYSHGGGWQPIPGFTANDKDHLKFPGDPPMRPQLKVEILRSNGSLRATLITYSYAFFALYEAGVVDGVEVCRMD